MILNEKVQNNLSVSANHSSVVASSANYNMTINKRKYNVFLLAPKSEVPNVYMYICGACYAGNILKKPF